MLRDATLQDKIFDFVTHGLEKEFWLAIKENIPAAYEKAYSIANNDFSEIPKSRVLPQLRRYSLDNAILNLCSSVEPELKWANHDGEHYVLLTSNEITLSYAAVNSGKKKPRKAKHRNLMARKNEKFERGQLDWLNPELDSSQSQSLHVVVIARNPSKSYEDQDKPSEIFVTVPFSNWSGYHLHTTLTEIISSYDNRTVQVYDGAWPQLKKEVLEAEKETQDYKKVE